jgi:hypothetical protein
MTSMPEIVSAETWQAERDELLAAEKEATRSLDAIAARRRRLPMVRFDNNKYVFDTPDGPKRLLDLFGAQQQLVVYQFMDRGPDEYCPGCTHFTNNVAGLPILANNDVAWVTVSNMPLTQIQVYKERKGWTVPFVSSHGTSFADDCGAGDGFMLSMFFAMATMSIEPTAPQPEGWTGSCSSTTSSTSLPTDARRTGKTRRPAGRNIPPTDSSRARHRNERADAVTTLPLAKAASVVRRSAYRGSTGDFGKDDSAHRGRDGLGSFDRGNDGYRAGRKRRFLGTQWDLRVHRCLERGERRGEPAGRTAPAPGRAGI